MWLNCTSALSVDVITAPMALIAGLMLLCIKWLTALNGLLHGAAKRLSNICIICIIISLMYVTASELEQLFSSLPK